MVKDAENQRRMDRLLAQGRQGCMLHSASFCAIEVWSTTVESLSSDQQKFILNSTVDTLPHNANLHLWKKKVSLDCLLCGERQSLIHVLSCCPIALKLRHYNSRHDAVLSVIAATIREYLPPTTLLSVDLGEKYSLPTHILQMDLRPDIVWWDSTSIMLVELTIPFEMFLHEAHDRKESTTTL